jgi:hypothetical protein
MARCRRRGADAIELKSPFQLEHPLKAISPRGRRHPRQLDRRNGYRRHVEDDPSIDRREVVEDDLDRVRAIFCFDIHELVGFRQLF